MADFFQNGVIATLHNLADRPVAELETDLAMWGQERPMTLIIPCLASELGSPALSHIVEELSTAHYLEEVVVGLDQADRQQFVQAQQVFSVLPQRCRVLWNDGPGLQTVTKQVFEHLGAPIEPGKGRNVWGCLGYVLGRGQAQVVALHDADIATYDRSLLARLLYPVAHPSFDYAFAKGFYARASADPMQLNGRVSRLYVTPLVRALAATFGRSDYLDYLESFRYPLAGEWALEVSVARSLRVPADWGLEIGVLSEIARSYPVNRICQVELADLYDHKHQDLSSEDSTAGLHRMSSDIAKAFFRKLAISGVVLTPESFRTLKAAYTREAYELIEHYDSDAAFNGFVYDRRQEEASVDLFGQAALQAGQDFLESPLESPFIPSWGRLEADLPGVGAALVAAVEHDQQNFR